MTPAKTHTGALSLALSIPLKRGAWACFALLACFAGAADVGSSAYVQAGLTAHWDGIDNTVTNGVRHHDPAATNWCDLSGQANHVWLPAFVSVESNALYSSVVTGLSNAQINGSKTELCPTLSKLNGLNHWTNDPAFTVEFVMQRVQWRYTDNYGNLQNVFRTPRGTAGYRNNVTNGFYFFGPTSKSNLSLMEWKPDAQADAMHTVSAVFGNSLSTDILRMDGVQNTINMNGGYNTGWSTNFTFFSNLRADIRVHAIRVYNRVLTQYELDRNALLDRIRFLGDTDVPFLVKPVPDQSFDGVHACTPEPVVVDPATEQRLVKGTDYALSYAANDRAGYATVTVTGLNAWSGHAVTVPFLICASDVYRVVEYIQSTGTQYIDTEYYPNPNTRMEAELLFVGDKGDRSAAKVGSSPFGCAESNGLASFSMNFGASEVQDNELFTWFEKTYGQGAAVKNKTITTRTTRSTFTVNAGTGAVKYGTVTWTAVPKTTTHSVNAMCLFGAGGADGFVTPFTVFGMRVFSWKIWDGGTLVRDFVPCYRVFDLAAGLLDRVSGRFFANAGTGAFSYDVTTYDAALPAAYRQLDALVATGAQHIATGVYADSNTAVTVEFTPYEVTAQRRVFAARATESSAVTANDLFFEAYVNAGNRWACCCTDGPYDSASDAAGLWSSGGAAPSAGYRTSFTLDSHGDAFYVNGAKQVSLARSRAQNSPVPIELMRAGGTADEYGWGKLYAAYIWQNGLIVRNFVPCYRVADGLTGLYDLVTETFFPSAGDSPFLHGTDGEEGIPHLTGVHRQSCLTANTCFWNLTNFSFTVWTKNPDVGRYGWETERYGTLFSQGALGNGQSGFACFMYYNTTNGDCTLSVQIRDKENQTLTMDTGAANLRTDGKWHHVAYTYDLGAGVARFYLDGKVVGSNTDPAKMVNPSLTWYIPVTFGGRNGDFPMKGELAYATLWNRAITENEVQCTRRHPVNGTEAGLIGRWSLDGGSAGVLDGVANGAAKHNLTPVGEVGFGADEVKWHVAGLIIVVK